MDIYQRMEKMVIILTPLPLKEEVEEGWYILKLSKSMEKVSYQLREVALMWAESLVKGEED